MLGAKAIHRQTIMDSVLPLLPPAIKVSAAGSLSGRGSCLFRSQAGMLKAVKTAALTKHRLDQPANPDRRREEQPERQARRCPLPTPGSGSAQQAGGEWRLS